MQAAHQYKASVGATPHHQAPLQPHGAEDFAALVVACVVLIGLPVLAFMVFWRGIRWFFRVTR